MDFSKIYKDSSKLKEKKIAFFEENDDIKDYLKVFDELGITYKEMPSYRHKFYKFKPSENSKEATFCYLNDGNFYTIKFEDMTFKGVCLGDFEMDVKQLKSIFESSDNKSPRMREDADIKSDYDEWTAKEKAHKEKLIKTCQDDPGRVIIEDVKSTHDDDYFLEKAVTAKITSIDELKSFVFANYGDYPVRITWPDKNLIPVTRITVINDFDD